MEQPPLIVSASSVRGLLTQDRRPAKSLPERITENDAVFNAAAGSYAPVSAAPRTAAS